MKLSQSIIFDVAPVFFMPGSFSIKNCGLKFESQEGMSVEQIIEWAKYAETGSYSSSVDERSSAGSSRT
jgi:hypothetical protein